jgi:Domain of unknown function (DUF397)
MLEAGSSLRWRRASRCESGACVEVAVQRDGVALRDSKQPDSAHLTFAPEQWRDFIAGIRSGEFDRP